jgi:hypothetical protein
MTVEPRIDDAFHRGTRAGVPDNAAY